MQEAPRYTLLEIQQMLSRYLDGLLELDQVQEVEGLLSRFPQYVEELRKLKIAQDALKTTLQNPVLEKVVDEESAWQSIAERLKSDQETGLRAFDPEFVSAYYDGEILALDSEFIEFESQLFHNAKANEMLAQMGEVSELVRQWGYRLESGCSVDLGQTVMARFLSESGCDDWLAPPAGLIQEAPAEAVLLSAYADQALTPRETIAANRLIESDPKAKLTLTHFNRLSEWIQVVSEQIQVQAPDFWPSVSQTLSRSPDAGGLMVTVDRFGTLKRWAKIAGPIAASILLVTIFMPARAPVAPSSAPTEQSFSVAAVGTPRQADVSPAVLTTTPNQTEIASVPVKHLNSRGLDLAFAGSRTESDVLTAVGNPTAAELRRVTESTVLQQAPEPAHLASRPEPKTAMEDSESRQLPPSSEEYLFSALNEQMPGEDISSMFGK